MELSNLILFILSGTLFLVVVRGYVNDLRDFVDEYSVQFQTNGESVWLNNKVLITVKQYKLEHFQRQHIISTQVLSSIKPIKLFQ